MSQKEFEAIIRQMHTEKVPLSISNIMVRTELPRDTVLKRLSEMEVAPSEASPPPTPFHTRVHTTAREMRGDFRTIELPKLPTHKRTWQIAAILGFVAGPLGLFYAAPLALAATASAIYVSALAVLHYVPFVGPAILGYIVPLVHIGCSATNAYFVFFRKKKKAS